MGGTPFLGPGGGGGGGYLLPRSGQGGGTMGRGYSCPGQIPEQGGYPQLEQHSVYLLPSGRYASCVHAGGLSYLG